MQTVPADLPVFEILILMTSDDLLRAHCSSGFLCPTLAIHPAVGRLFQYGGIRGRPSAQELT